MAEHSLGQVVAYLTVCEILVDASTGADGVLWYERSGFCRCGFATLGYTFSYKSIRLNFGSTNVGEAKNHMNRKTGKTSLVFSCTYCLFLFAGVIIFFGHGISSAAEVTLAWDANTETDLMGYKIHYDTSPGNPYYGTDADQGMSPIIVFLNDLDDLHNPKFTLTGLGDSGDYYFALTAFDNENLESGFSNEASTAEGNSGGGSRGSSSGGGGCFTVTSAIGLPDF